MQVVKGSRQGHDRRVAPSHRDWPRMIMGQLAIVGLHAMEEGREDTYEQRNASSFLFNFLPSLVNASHTQPLSH